MQHMLKILVRLILNKQQRLIASYNKQSKISVSSASSESESDSWSDQRMPKMLDSIFSKQEHNKIVRKLVDEYIEQNIAFDSFKLLHGVYSNEELVAVKPADSNTNQHDLIHRQAVNLNQIAKRTHDSTLKSLDQMNVSATNLLDKLEEQKVRTPKSSVSVSNLVQKTSTDLVQCFDEFDINGI